MVLTPDSGVSPPTSPPHPTSPMLGRSPQLAPMASTSAGHRQTTPDDQVNTHDETTFRDGNGLDDNEYLDYSVASDTGDDDSDSSENDNTDDNTSDGLDCADARPSIDDGGSNLNHLLNESEGTQPEEESWAEPTIVHFPGRRAGEVCSTGITSMQQHENAFGGRSENPYSPFASKIDWEFAKWAKLRGPSATSFTELLNISGVSVIHRSCCFVTSLTLSSCTSN